jgi:hypothetical protein
MGDFNDEPFDIAVVDHLQASSELDRVIGPTNEINGFAKETADYRGDDTFLSAQATATQRCTSLRAATLRLQRAAAAYRAELPRATDRPARAYRSPTTFLARKARWNDASAPSLASRDGSMGLGLAPFGVAA